MRINDAIEMKKIHQKAVAESNHRIVWMVSEKVLYCSDCKQIIFSQHDETNDATEGWAPGWTECIPLIRDIAPLPQLCAAVA